MRLDHDRRRILKAAGAGGIGAVVSQLVGPYAPVAQAAPTTKFVFFWHANGAPVSSPPGNTSFMNGVPGMKARTLSYPSHADHKFGMPFSLDGKSGNSPIPGDSIDQQVAKKLGSTALVLTGVAKHQNYRGWVSYRGGSNVLPIQSPRLGFEAAFGVDPGGGGPAPIPGMPVDPAKPAPSAGSVYSPEVEAAIFGSALEDAQRMWQRLPKGPEKEKMEFHIEAIRQLAGKVNVPLAPAQALKQALKIDDCGNKQGLAQMFVEPAGGWDVPTRVKKHCELIAVAFACGKRVATLMVTPGGHDSMNFAFIGVPGADPHNQLAHTQPGGSAMQKIKQWDMDVLKYLVQQLQSTPDPAGGTLYDNTLVLVATETAFGNHSNNGVPVGVTGGLAGRVSMGSDYAGILASCLGTV